MGMKFNYVIGNPPYQKPAKGTIIPEKYKIVGTYQLYYCITKLGLDALKDDGTLIFVQPTGWQRGTKAIKLRNWLKDNNWKIDAFEDITAAKVFRDQGAHTTAGIVRIVKGKESNFIGKEALYLPEPWIQEWVHQCADGKLNAYRGGVKVNTNLPAISYYQRYKIFEGGVIEETGQVSQRKTRLPGDKIILLPQFFGSNVSKLWKTIDKAQIVDNKPFSTYFIGIAIPPETNPKDMLAWIKSDTFKLAITGLVGSAHLGTTANSGFFLSKARYTAKVMAIHQQSQMLTLPISQKPQKSPKENHMIERSQERIKKTGEVFTPIELVRTMLDSLAIDWKNPPLDKTFLDPTCGEGVFLLELAERGIPLHNLYGVDIMPDNIDCLKSQLIQHYGDTPENVAIINNNIRCADALSYDYTFEAAA